MSVGSSGPSNGNNWGRTFTTLQSGLKINDATGAVIHPAPVRQRPVLAPRIPVARVLGTGGVPRVDILASANSAINSVESTVYSAIHGKPSPYDTEAMASAQYTDMIRAGATPEAANASAAELSGYIQAQPDKSPLNLGGAGAGNLVLLVVVVGAAFLLLRS